MLLVLLKSSVVRVEHLRTVVALHPNFVRMTDEFLLESTVLPDVVHLLVLEFDHQVTVAVLFWGT